MDKIKSILKPKADPQQQLRDWQRRLRQECRNIERQIRDLQREEKGVEKTIKEAAKRNDIGSAKSLAKEIVGSRKAVNRLHENKAQLNSISMHLGESVAIARTVGHLSKSAEVMKIVNNLMKAPEMAATMQEFSKEMTKAGVIEETVNDALDTALDSEDIEEETEEEVDKVLSELAGEMAAQLPEAERKVRPFRYLSPAFSVLLSDADENSSLAVLLPLMDSVITKPTFCSFRFSFSNPNTKPLQTSHFSFFKFNRFKKLKNSSISVSCRNPSNSQNPKSNWSRIDFPIKPTCVLVPLLYSFKKLVLSHAQKWVSLLQGYRESEKVLVDNGGKYLQSSGIGIALLSVTTHAKVKFSPFVAQLAANPTFVSGLFAWMIAQSTKVLLNFFVEKKWDLRLMCASGGMPSSHSALCTALSTSVALCHGVADSLFPVCLGFSLIVMYDAIGVRRHAGMQAEVLNMIVEDLFQGHPISKRKLKELLGHTPSQVLAGAVLGIVVAYVCCQSCLVAT